VGLPGKQWRMLTYADVCRRMLTMEICGTTRQAVAEWSKTLQRLEPNPGKGIVPFQLNQTLERVLLRCGAINNCGRSVIELTSQHDGQKAAAETAVAGAQKPVAGANLQPGMRQHTAEIVVPQTSLAGASPPAAKKARIEEGSETGKMGGGSRSGGAPWQSAVDDEVEKMKAKHAHELNMLKLRQEKEMQDLKGQQRTQTDAISDRNSGGSSGAAANVGQQRTQTDAISWQQRTQTEIASDTKASPLQTLEGIIEEKRKQIERNSYDKSLPLASFYDKEKVSFLEPIFNMLKDIQGRLEVLEKRS
jgi:hypothetical protein